MPKQTNPLTYHHITGRDTLYPTRQQKATVANAKKKVGRC